MTTNKIPAWFWIVSIIALLWNALGVFAFYGDMTISQEAIAKLPAWQQAGYNNYPLYSKILFAVSTIGGLIGCIGLFIRKSWACILLFISMISVLVQFADSMFVRSMKDHLQGTDYILPLLVIVIAIGLFFFSRSAKSKHWLS